MDKTYNHIIQLYAVDKTYFRSKTKTESQSMEKDILCK
jgi:hypothetical protein